jgi:hypothetical protein
MTDENKNLIAEPEVKAPEVKAPEVKAPEVKTLEVKTPEINWQERATQAEEKLKGVDLDKWAKVKDLDPDEVAEAMKAYGIMSADDAKFQKVMAILEAKEEAATAAAAGKPTTALDEKVAALESKLNGIEKAKHDEVRAAWNKRYGASVEDAVSKQKEVKELSPLEKKAVREYVNEKFREDARQKKPVLGIPDVSKFVDEAIKEVKEHRAFILGKSVKSDTSPDGISGGKAAGTVVEKKKPTDAGTRINNTMKDFAQIQADKKLVV